MEREDFDSEEEYEAWVEEDWAGEYYDNCYCCACCGCSCYLNDDNWDWEDEEDDYFESDEG